MMFCGRGGDDWGCLAWEILFSTSSSLWLANLLSVSVDQQSLHLDSASTLKNAACPQPPPPPHTHTQHTQHNAAPCRSLAAVPGPSPCPPPPHTHTTLFTWSGCSNRFTKQHISRPKHSSNDSTSSSGSNCAGSSGTVTWVCRTGTRSFKA